MDELFIINALLIAAGMILLYIIGYGHGKKDGYRATEKDRRVKS